MIRIRGEYTSMDNHQGHIHFHDCKACKIHSENVAKCPMHRGPSCDWIDCHYSLGCPPHVHVIYMHRYFIAFRFSVFINDIEMKQAPRKCASHMLYSCFINCHMACFLHVLSNATWHVLLNPISHVFCMTYLMCLFASALLIYHLTKQIFAKVLGLLFRSATRAPAWLVRVFLSLLFGYNLRGDNQKVCHGIIWGVITRMFAME